VKLKRLLQCATVVLIGGLAVGAIAGSAAKTSTTLNVRLSNDFPSLDPMVDGTNAFGWAAVTPGYDRFVSVNANGKGFGPYLATSWTQKPKSIVFRLRRDATCTDGHVLTAVDMLNSIKRFIFVPKRGGSAASTSAGGWGPGPYHLHANNKTATLSLAVDKPWGPLLGLFAGLPVICPAGLDALKTDSHALENQIYGSGPYSLVSAKHGDQVVYKLRPGWKWGPPGTSTKTMPTNLVYKIVTDQTTAANLFITGGLDAGALAGADVARLLTNNALAHKQAANWVATGVNFNMRAGRPFELGVGDALREAIYTAVDPKAFNQVVFDGRAIVTPSLFRPGAQCYDKKTLAMAPKPSIDKAQAILKAAGYTVVNGRLSKNGTAVPKMSLVSSSTLFPNGGAYVLSVLQNLGFDVQLNDLGSTYGSTVIGGNFDISLFYANRPSPEAGTQMNGLFGVASPAAANIGSTGQGDPLWTKYYLAGLQNVGAGSCRYFALVQESNIKNHYFTPLVSPNYDIFYRKSLVTKFPTWPPEVFGFPWHYVAVHA
jgi:peptide/nickel transport system substrate-binding protein